MGGVGWVACQGFLVREACVCPGGWSWISSLLGAIKFPVVSFEMSLGLGWPFRILEVCGSSLLWSFLTVGGVGWVACQGFLVREACGSVLVDEAGFLFSGVQ